MRAGRRLWVARVLVGSMVSLLAGLFTQPAAAQDRGSDLGTEDQIVLNGRLFVPEGEAVGTAVIFNGPATVEGTVSETLVVFHGRTEISGSVEGDVVVFSGRVVLRSGAEVGGDVVSRTSPELESGAKVRGDTQNIATRFDFENLGFASRIVWWVGYSISTLILGLLLLLLIPALDGAIVDAWRNRTGAAIGFGVATFFLVPIAAIIFLVIIVAIPLGLFILLGLALLYTIGFVAGAHTVGRRLIRPPGSRFLAFLTGWVILRVLGLIPFLGGLVWLLAAILGLGVLVVAARGRPAPAPMPVPPPPAPTHV